MLRVANMLTLMQLIGAECTKLFKKMLFTTYSQVWAQHMLWVLEICRNYDGSDKVMTARKPEIDYWIRWTTFFASNKQSFKEPVELVLNLVDFNRLLDKPASFFKQADNEKIRKKVANLLDKFQICPYTQPFRKNGQGNWKAHVDLGLTSYDVYAAHNFALAAERCKVF